MMAPAIAALGHKIVNAAFAFLVARIPVLDGGIFDLGFIMGDELHHRRMQLVFIARGGRAAFKIAHISALIGDDEGALELAGVLFIDAEIGRKLHRAAGAGRNVDERAIRKDGGVERGKIIIRLRHNGAEIFLHQFGMLAHGFGERTEDDAGFSQFRLERRHYRNRVKHGIHGNTGASTFHACEDFAFTQRHAQLFISGEQFGIDLIQALGAGGLFGG